MTPGIAPVAVDAMGGDHAPAAVVHGAIDAARKGQPVILVGPEERVRGELERQRASWSLPIQVKHASEVVEMGDHPGQAMRRKKENSIRACFELVRSGEASGMVSAGNSGAVMAGAVFVLGRAGEVERPAILSVLPAVKGAPVLLDVGANVECRPLHLVQFALMGDVYSRRVQGVSRPRVAVLANGQESSKGTAVTRAAAAALERSPLRFQGYCEGRDLLEGDVDVIVTDGFTGNVILKVSESLVHLVEEALKQEITRSLQASMGFLLSKDAFRSFKKRLDYTEYGGAPLLGVNGACLIGHGRSTAKAVRSAVRAAHEFVQHQVPAKIRAKAQEFAPGALRR